MIGMRLHSLRIHPRTLPSLTRTYGPNPTTQTHRRCGPMSTFSHQRINHPSGLTTHRGGQSGIVGPSHRQRICLSPRPIPSPYHPLGIANEEKPCPSPEILVFVNTLSQFIILLEAIPSLHTLSPPSHCVPCSVHGWHFFLPSRPRSMADLLLPGCRENTATAKSHGWLL